jgi:hypothetical protein
MKRILGILSVLLVLAVSVLAVTDTETVPVYLEVPAFVRITVDEVDGAFNLVFDPDLVFDPADPESTVEDTVALLAEANVNYDVDFSLLPVQSYSNWASLISVTIDDSVDGFGLPGEVSFNATAYINVIDLIDHLSYGTVPANTHIADVVFTISSK